MEKYLGRMVARGEVVHHRNSKRDDNGIENLVLFNSNTDHMRWHAYLEQLGMRYITGQIPVIKNAAMPLFESEE